MPKRRLHRKERISWIAYVIAIASFIPLIGIPFGISSIAWGISQWKMGGKRLVALGASGIMLTIGIYSYLFLIGNRLDRTGELQSAKAEIAEYQLLELVESIEFFKLTKGYYPSSLEELSEKSKLPVLIQDQTQVRLFSLRHSTIPNYYYELDTSGETYYLLGVGVDSQPFTEDDILPEIAGEEMKNIGYRVKVEGVP